MSQASQPVNKVIRFLTLFLACFVGTLALTTPAFGILVTETVGTCYDATDAYDCPENSTAAYEDAARAPTAEEKLSTGATNTLFGQFAESIAADSTAPLSGVQLNKAIGDATSDAIASRYPAALREVPFQTVGGTRIAGGE